MDKMFSSNTTVKLLALVLAVVLWLYVTQDQQPKAAAEVSKVYYRVTLSPKNVSPGLRLISIPAELDSITLRGPQNLIDVVTPKDLVATIDLAGQGEGNHEVPISVQIPSGLKLAGTSPNRVQVTLDAVVARQLNVRVDILGVPGKGLAAHDASVRPSQVFVDGPRTVVDQVAAVVAKASVNDATTVVTESLPLKAIDKNGKELSGITVSPAVVDVVVPIGLPLKEVPVKPVVNGQPAAGYAMGAIQVDPLTVRVVGPKDILDKLEFISTEPIDISKADADISKDLRLVLPEQVTVSAPSPEKAKVVVRITKSAAQPPTTGTGTPTTPPTTPPSSGTTPP